MKKTNHQPAKYGTVLKIIIVAIIAAIFIFKLISAAISEWPMIFRALTEQSLNTTLGIVMFIFLNIYFYIINQLLYNIYRKRWIIANKKVCWWLAKAGFILLIINGFPLTHSFGLLKNYSIIIGGLAIVAIGLLLISHCIYKKLETAIIITPIIFLLLLCYYADAFIFSGWQRPWLSLSMFIFIAIIALIIFLINRSKRRAIEKWQKNE